MLDLVPASMQGIEERKKFFNGANFSSLGLWGKDAPTNGTNT